MLITSMLLLASSNMLPPPRDSGIRIMSSQSLVALQACVTREMIRDGNVARVPAVNGIDLDYFRPNAMGNTNAARYSLRLRETDKLREISVFYRHPFSRRAAYFHTKKFAGRCFPSEFAVSNPR